MPRSGLPLPEADPLDRIIPPPEAAQVPSPHGGEGLMREASREVETGEPANGPGYPPAAYVPRIAAEWDLDAAGRSHQVIEGTLCFVDISGFTRLSERLAQRGRIGAEELTEVLTRVFGTMLDRAYLRGGNLLKFGGDALLLLFRGPDHPLHAACAAVEMRASLRRAAEIPTSVGRIDLKMSVGIHTGAVHLFMAGSSHRELIVAGPTASVTTEMEKVADANEIVVSREMADVLPPGAVSREKGPGWLLRWRKAPFAAGRVIPRRWVLPEAIDRCIPVSLRDHLRQSVIEPEHRLATVGFVRFGGVDGLMRTEGAEAVARAIETVIEAIESAAEAEGVTFLASDVDSDGGKVILTAGVPVAREDDEGRMLRALRSILDTSSVLEVRSGVNRGHVFAGQVGNQHRRAYTVMGDTVNLAARLMAAAPRGSIYTRRDVLDASNTRFEAEPLEPLLMKGVTAPVHAFSVGAEIGTKTTADHRLPFIGREAERGSLQEMIERTRTGWGGTVSVVGETGIGKTRLVEEALQAASDLWAIQVQGEPGAASLPYRALRDPLLQLLAIERTTQARMRTELTGRIASLAPALEPMLPLIADAFHIDIPDTPETAAIEARFRQERTAEALLGLIEVASTGPGVVVIEDAHWLDEASTQVIHRIIEAANERPWLALVTRRAEPTGLRPATGAVIELDPLTPEETEGLVIAATESAPLRVHEVTALVERAGGNPLFVAELVRVVGSVGSLDTVPDTLGGLVSAQIDALPALARNLLMYASVFGLSFRREVLTEFLRDEEIEMDAATRRELDVFLVRQGRDRLGFRHALIRDSAYHSLSFRRRRHLHARAGTVIERLAGGDAGPVAGTLALHFLESHDYPPAWRYGRMAGDRAREAYANVAAATHYERALEAARRLGSCEPSELAEVWTHLAHVREQAGLFGPAFDALRQATRLVSADPVGRAGLHFERARTRLRVGAHSAALRETALGLNLVGSVDSVAARQSRARLLAVRGVARLQQGRAREALVLAEDAAELAGFTGEDDALARAYSVMDGAFELLGQPDRAVYEPKALEIYKKMGHVAGTAVVANNLGVKAYAEGRWQEAIDWYSEAQAAFRRLGNETQAQFAAANLGEVFVSQRRVAEAEEVLTGARRALRAHDVVEHAIFAEIQLARLSLELGEIEAASQLLRQLLEEATAIGHAGWVAEARINLATALVRCHDPEGALELIGDLEVTAGDEAALYAASLARVRAEALMLAGRADQALAEADEAVTTARRLGLPYEEALSRLIRLHIRTSRGDGDNTEDAQEAGRLLDALGVVSTDLPTGTSDPRRYSSR